MIELHQKRNLVRVLPCDRSQDAERGGHGIAPAFDGQFHDVLGIEVRRVRRKRRTGGVLDALVDRKNGHVPGAGEPAMIQQRLQAGQHGRWAIRHTINTLDVVGPGEMQRLFWNGLALMLKQSGRFFAENFFESGTDGLDGHDFLALGCL